MAPYRDATDFVRAQAEALRARRRDELHTIPTGWRSVYVQRAARLAAGAAGVVGAMALAGMIAAARPRRARPVSYTHLTLPTSDLV